MRGDSRPGHRRAARGAHGPWPPTRGRVRGGALSPTAGTVLARIAAASVDGFRPELRIVEQPAPDWTPLLELSSAEERAARHRAIAGAAGPGAPAQLPIVWEVEAIAWLIGVLVGGGLLRCAAYLDPDPRSVWVRIDSYGLPAGLALAANTGCRADGPRGAQATITRLLEPCVGGAEARRPRVLWWHAGDRVADAVLWCGEAFGAQADARRVAAALLAAGVPYSVSLGIERDGQPRTRRTCCLSRRTEGGVECEGCPHRARRAAARPILGQGG